MYSKFIKLIVIRSLLVCCGFAGRVLNGRFPQLCRTRERSTSQGQRNKIRLFDWLGSQLLERDTNFTGNGGRRSPAVIIAPFDLDGRPNSFTRSGNSLKK